MFGSLESSSYCRIFCLLLERTLSITTNFTQTTERQNNVHNVSLSFFTHPSFWFLPETCRPLCSLPGEANPSYNQQQETTNVVYKTLTDKHDHGGHDMHARSIFRPVRPVGVVVARCLVSGHSFIKSFGWSVFLRSPLPSR